MAFKKTTVISTEEKNPFEVIPEKKVEKFELEFKPKTKEVLEEEIFHFDFQYTTPEQNTVKAMESLQNGWDEVILVQCTVNEQTFKRIKYKK